MNDALMKFYQAQSPSREDKVFPEPSRNLNQNATNQKKAKKLHVSGSCAYATRTGCQYDFRGRQCCLAVMRRECQPPKTVLQVFADGGSQYLSWRVDIAMGCYSDEGAAD